VTTAGPTFAANRCQFAILSRERKSLFFSNETVIFEAGQSGRITINSPLLYQLSYRGIRWFFVKLSCLAVFGYQGIRLDDHSDARHHFREALERPSLIKTGR
jgi:hypothetical protein